MWRCDGKVFWAPNKRVLFYMRGFWTSLIREILAMHFGAIFLSKKWVVGTLTYFKRAWTKHKKGMPALSDKAWSHISKAIICPTFTMYVYIRPATRETCKGWSKLLFPVGRSLVHTTNHKNIATKVRDTLLIGYLKLVNQGTSTPEWRFVRQSISTGHPEKMNQIFAPHP